MKRPRAAAIVRGFIVALVAAIVIVAILPKETAGPTGKWMARAGVTPLTAHVGALDLRYVRKGAGAPLILVHGLASKMYTWADVIGPLADHFDVIALDLPGFGESTHPGDLVFSDLPKAVVGLMDSLGIAKASVAGNSLGGAITLVLAERYPDRVDRIVVLDSAGFNMRPKERPFMIRLIGSPWASWLADRVPVKRTLARATLRHLIHDPSRVTDERIEEYVASIIPPGSLAPAQSLLRSPLDERFEPDLSKITAPTLIVWGRYDPWLPEAHADRFVRAIKGARKIVLDTGHMPQEEKPAEVARLIGEHLAS